MSRRERRKSWGLARLSGCGFKVKNRRTFPQDLRADGIQKDLFKIKSLLIPVGTIEGFRMRRMGEEQRWETGTA